MDSGDREESESNPFEKNGKEKWVWIKNKNLIEIHKKRRKEGVKMGALREMNEYIYICIGKRCDFE